jgi:hypothetical protein
MKRFFSVFVIVFAASAISNGQKLPVEQIIANHLGSIGSADARSKNTNVSVVGDVQFTSGPSAPRSLNGRGVFSSEGNKILFAMTFPQTMYPLEKVTWDGKNLGVGFPTQGLRSALGDFIFRNEDLFREGLFGGVLSKSWVMLDLAARKGKLSAEGTKKIDGKQVYLLTYEPKKGIGLTIKMYFDAETFRHLRTEYTRTISPQMGATPETSARQSESYERLTEDFFDFKEENGLVLPRGYRVTLANQTNNVAHEYKYLFLIRDAYYNQKLDPSTFSKDGN